MKLQTAIQETVLREATIVAGHDHLEREITWPHIIDHTDVVEWVEPGELLMMTGINWPNDQLSSRDLIRQLSRTGLAGIVLAVPHFLEHFPPEAIEEANARGVPLLELPWTVQFSQVTHEISVKIINLQADIIERSERIHRALTNAAVSANSLSDIASVLGSLLGRAVTFSDLSGNVLGGSEGPNALALMEKQFVDLFQNDAQTPDIFLARRPTLIDFIADGHFIQRLCFPVRLQNTAVSLIWLEKPDAEISELEMRALEHASVVAALLHKHQQQLGQQEERLGYALVAGLLDGEFTPTASALERARVSGWSEAKQYRVCLILIDEPIPLTSEGLARRERWVEKLKRELRARDLPVLVAIWLNQIKFIAPANAPLSAIWESFSGRHAAMAVSRVHIGVKGMAFGAQDVAALMPSLRPGRMHQFDEILFPRALMGDADARAMLVKRLVTPLAELRRGDALLDTLNCLADEGFQFANTAKTLGIHISTLRYRIERIEDVLSISLEDPRVRFEIQVAVTLHRLMNE